MEMELETLQLLMFSGKGGVGKTTIASSFARHLARKFPQSQIWLLSTDPAHSLGDVLQVPVSNTPQPLPDLPNLRVQALDAKLLRQDFQVEYGAVLQLLVERGSFVEGQDLAPVWDMSWPGLDELMGLLEIQRLLRENLADKLVVDMAPTGHALNLLHLMDFLDNLLGAVELFQEKHRVVSKSFTGRYREDEGDDFLHEMKANLAGGRELLQDAKRAGLALVAIAEPMSLAETQRFHEALKPLSIPFQGIFVNRLLPDNPQQQRLLPEFLTLAGDKTLFTIPETTPPIGAIALDQFLSQWQDGEQGTFWGGAGGPGGALSLSKGDQGKIPPVSPSPSPVVTPSPRPPVSGSPPLPDFLAEGRRLLIIGGKGGVGKTTVAAALGWGIAQRHPEKQIRIISIDPAHSLGDAFGQPLGHEPRPLAPNLSGQEIDADIVLNQFREDYLWQLAEMMSGDSGDTANPISIAYGPQAWRQIVSQSLPGIDEMLSLIEVMAQLERGEMDLIIIDAAPTGHLLRFLEMPSALGDWLAWIFKLWLKYQDVLGRVEFMGSLRQLRQKVVKAQKHLQDPEYTEFIGVMGAEPAILAEAERLTASLLAMGITQRYIVHNRYCAGVEINPDLFPEQSLVRLPLLPPTVLDAGRIVAAANLLLSGG
ncbi:MAG: hypothetical protein Fur0025_15630 [Oscillatoriaceae cyanobacterium]